MKSLTPLLALAAGMAAGFIIASMVGADTFAMKIGLPTAA